MIQLNLQHDCCIKGLGVTGWSQHPVWLGGVRSFSHKWIRSNLLMCFPVEHMHVSCIFLIHRYFIWSVTTDVCIWIAQRHEPWHPHTNEPPWLLLFIPSRGSGEFIYQKDFILCLWLICTLSLWVTMFLSKLCSCFGRKHAENVCWFVIDVCRKINFNKL